MASDTVARIDRALDLSRRLDVALADVDRAMAARLADPDSEARRQELVSARSRLRVAIAESKEWLAQRQAGRS